MSDLAQDGKLVWIDIETTGLDETVHVPLEIGIAVTDADLNILFEKAWRMKHPELRLDALDPWALEVHGKNGLLAECVKDGQSVHAVEAGLASIFLRGNLFEEFCVGDNKPPLCGSTISFDRAWLKKWFPDVYSNLHYRSVDVSSLKELMKRWKPDVAISRKETSVHRSLPDLHDSIEELAVYRAALNW